MRITCNTSTLTALAITKVNTHHAITYCCPLWSNLSKRCNSSDTAAPEVTAATSAACPHLAFEQTTAAIHHTAEWQNALPYHEIPGPKPIPILGNTWRYANIVLLYLFKQKQNFKK